jgi:hypothetical protein
LLALRFLEHSGGQGNKQQHECNSSSTEMTAVDWAPSPDAPIEGLLMAELDSNANTNWSFSKVAYRSPSLLGQVKTKMLIPLNLVGGLIWTKNYFKVGKKPERQL